MSLARTAVTEAHKWSCHRMAPMAEVLPMSVSAVTCASDAAVAGRLLPGCCSTPDVCLCGISHRHACRSSIDVEPVSVRGMSYKGTALSCHVLGSGTKQKGMINAAKFWSHLAKHVHLLASNKKLKKLLTSRQHMSNAKTKLRALRFWNCFVVTFVRPKTSTHKSFFELPWCACAGFRLEWKWCFGTSETAKAHLPQDPILFCGQMVMCH